MLDKIVFRNKNYVFKKAEEELVLIYPEEEQFLAFNEVATRIWELADGTRTVKQIINEICGEYEGKRKKIEQETMGFIEDLNKRRILRLVLPKNQ